MSNDGPSPHNTSGPPEGYLHQHHHNHLNPNNNNNNTAAVRPWWWWGIPIATAPPHGTPQQQQHRQQQQQQQQQQQRQRQTSETLERNSYRPPASNQNMQQDRREPVEVANDVSKVSQNGFSSGPAGGNERMNQPVGRDSKTTTTTTTTPTTSSSPKRRPPPLGKSADHAIELEDEYSDDGSKTHPRTTKHSTSRMSSISPGHRSSMAKLQGRSGGGSTAAATATTTTTTTAPSLFHRKSDKNFAPEQEDAIRTIYPFDVAKLHPLPIKLAPTSPDLADERYIELVCKATGQVHVKFKGMHAASKALGVPRTLISLSCRNYGSKGSEVHPWKTFSLRYGSNKKKNEPDDDNDDDDVYVYGTQTQDLFPNKETHHERLQRWYSSSNDAAPLAPPNPTNAHNKPTSSSQSKRSASDMSGPPGGNHRSTNSNTQPSKLARKDPPRQPTTPPITLPPQPPAITAAAIAFRQQQRQYQQQLLLEGGTVSEEVPIASNNNNSNNNNERNSFSSATATTSNQKASNNVLGLCIMCQQQSAQIVFQPCYHAVLCENCNKSCPTFCPVCRCTIAKRIRPTNSIKHFQPRIYSAHAFM